MTSILTAESTATAAASLYRRILGDAWRNVAPEVRAAHFEGRNLERRGLFQVRRGTGRTARLLATLLRLPPAGDAVPVELRVEADGNGERWIRKFGRRRLITRQREEAEGLLDERFGPLELRFEVEAADGGLSYRTVAGGLLLGPLRIRLPRGLRPEVVARERAAEGGATYVVVEVALPGIGRLIRYEGRLYADPPTREATP